MTHHSKPDISINLTAAQRTAAAELFPHLRDRLKLLDKRSKAVRFTLDELKSLRREANAAMSQAKRGMKRNSLRHIAERVDEAVERRQGIGAIPARERIYQFRISLQDIEPPIWRRIQIRNCTLDRLHGYIQLAFGWWNYHLHQFLIRGERYGDPFLLDDGYDDFGWIDSAFTKISEIVPRDGGRFRFEYEYDFGDCWLHEVLFEGCLRAAPGERYPLCLEGERACPPEDVGGPWGYAEYLEAMSDPNHERREEFRQWRGPFDPEQFDASKTTKKMRRGLPKSWDIV